MRFPPPPPVPVTESAPPPRLRFLPRLLAAANPAAPSCREPNSLEARGCPPCTSALIRNRDVGKSVDSQADRRSFISAGRSISPRTEPGDPNLTRLHSGRPSESGGSVPGAYKRVFASLRRLPVWLISGNMAESRSDHPEQD
ncbi:hypothetical protein CRENBAI_025112 [Crenichthys baileyi]|uniref:Uncharacterized protein n=1 Tax=Crenichthys baileyi TaxID=28760 RepID=A0AAV9SNU7_9TELE